MIIETLEVPLKNNELDGENTKKILTDMLYTDKIKSLVDEVHLMYL